MHSKIDGEKHNTQRMTHEQYLLSVVLKYERIGRNGGTTTSFVEYKKSNTAKNHHTPPSDGDEKREYCPSMAVAAAVVVVAGVEKASKCTSESRPCAVESVSSKSHK